MKARMAALEADRNRRDGAVGVVETIIKSPLIGWFVGLAITALAIVKGWIHIR